MMTRMMIDTMSSTVRMAPNIAMKESCMLRSLIVTVCVSRSSKILSIVAEMSALCDGSSTRVMTQPMVSRRASGIESFRYDQWKMNCERSSDFRAAV